MTLLLDAATLDDAQVFFENRGTLGCEGTGMIASDGSATRFVAPAQEATAVPHCTVEVTAEGKLALAAALGSAERYVARIHSHPGLAFHSPIDNANPAITHDGALSIVVPFFGLGLRRGLDTCAVFVRRAGDWVDVPAGPKRDLLVRVR